MQASTTASRLSFHRSTRAFARLTLLGATVCVLATTAAQAQLTYSIEFQGPTIGLLDAATMTPIGPGDLLVTGPAGGPPAIVLQASAIPIAASAATGLREVDALSFGNDPVIDCNGNPSLLFSVDEFAVGFTGMAPDVVSEGALGNEEASADIYLSTVLPAMCPGAAGAGNTGFADGDGVVPFAAPGLNLIEPNPPIAGGGPDPGDNLDALACSNFTGQIFFSLDAAWADRIEGPDVHSGTALANGVSPGAVLVAGPGGGFSVYATFLQLGLGFSDDVDALLVRENGNGVFDPPVAPFDWINGQTDMLLFSVTRDSPLVGMADAIFGVPISEGDVLMPTGGGPGIAWTAESLGLWTLRTHGANPLPSSIEGFDDVADDFSDNLDALSLRICPQMGDDG